jgi:AbrB family looped-hinge helix DNA binding protein
MHTARVTTNGRLTLPRQLRRKFGIKPGTKVCFIERGTEIILQPITKAYIRSVCGMLKSKTSVTRELLKERRQG